jgi:hypothetical protein
MQVVAPFNKNGCKNRISIQTSNDEEKNFLIKQQTAELKSF